MAEDKYELDDNNIFKYATKELSQDAFLCWLISWYNDKNRDNELYNISKKFIKTIISKAQQGNNIKLDEYKLDIKKQYNNIDILIKLSNKNNNSEKYIIIEDKIDTFEHNEQIKKYKNKLNKDCITVYYKMIDYIEEQKNNADVQIDINDMLKIINDTKSIKCDIFQSYKIYLENRKKILNNYKKIYFRDWTKHREIYWKYLNNYKQNNNYKIHVLENVQIQSGGIYIDFEDIKKKINIGSGIYFALNFMSEDNCYIDIRLREPNVKASKENKKQYAEKIKKKLTDIVNKYPIKTSIVSVNGKKASKSATLLQLKLNDETSLDNFELNELINEMYMLIKNEI